MCAASDHGAHARPWHFRTCAPIWRRLAGPGDRGAERLLSVTAAMALRGEAEEGTGRWVRCSPKL